MPSPLDQTDRAILRSLELDSRLTVEAIASRVGTSGAECAARIVELETDGHIGGYTIVRTYPDPTNRPVSGLIRVIRDPTRSGADLLRSLDFIPEILTAEIDDQDSSLLLRVQLTNSLRLAEIVASLQAQTAVLSVHGATSTVLLTRPSPVTQEHQ
ncbi:MULTISPECIES: Lrp/AsnC family transcriptional regulator [Terrabacteria group]|uniref:Lrp/AsnC family transcriptional regulator n=1 Tax=Bacillati TaxID=1783272 RepID=UPI0036272196